MKHIFHAVALTFFGISHCFSLSIIESTHSDRLDKFITNKNDENIIKNTTTIYSVLSDEERVDRSRPATDIERKTIFQSIMATRIIDGGISVNGQAIIANFSHTTIDEDLSDHFEIISLTDQISQLLVKQFKERGCKGINFDYLTGFDRLKKLSGVQENLFKIWFLESLGQHYKEFSLEARLETLKCGGRPIVLVLGAVPSEAEHFDFSTLDNPGVFYVNRESSTVWPDQLIIADFNLKKHRTDILKIFAASADLIVPDWCVTYFMRLDKDFITDFTAMLKVNGKMILKGPLSDFHAMVKYDGWKNSICLSTLHETDIGESTCSNIYGGHSAYKDERRLYSKNYSDVEKKTKLYGKIKLWGIKTNQLLEDEISSIDRSYSSYLWNWNWYHAPLCRFKLYKGADPYYNGYQYAPDEYIEITKSDRPMWEDQT